VNARAAVPAVRAASTPARPAKKPLQHRIVGVFTVLIVPAIFVGTSIPVTALAGPAASVATFADAGEQHVSVGADTTALKVDRAAYDATTEQELQAARTAARAAALSASAASASGGDYSTVSGPRAPGDDYPWRNSGGGSLSPLGYVMRQCTDFVAWRLNQDAGSSAGSYRLTWSKMTPGGGNASQWASQWKRNGWKTSHKPVRGAVAWFNGNHVAYVKSVDGNKVNLEEYNWGSDGRYHTRTMSAASIPLFLYPPP
jgi:surface antigen